MTEDNLEWWEQIERGLESCIDVINSTSISDNLSDLERLVLIREKIIGIITKTKKLILSEAFDK